MLKPLPLILILFFFFSCSPKGELALSLAELPENDMAFQKMLIAQLTGETAIKTEGKEEVFIKSRWTLAEKELSIAYLKEVITKIGLTSKRHSYVVPNTNFGLDLLLEPISGTNLYVTLPSTNGSDEYVLMGAHYDTGGKGIPGAIDNGSGIALILSVLRKAMALKNRNKNLMIVFFDQEEESISAGSIAFADYLKKTDAKIHSVHSFDMIGWDADHNKEVEIELPSAEIEKIYQKHASLLDIPIYTTDINSSDHYSFIKAGINAVGVSQAYAKGDNSGKKDTPADQYHLVNFDYLQSCSELAYEVIKAIIND